MSGTAHHHRAIKLGDIKLALSLFVLFDQQLTSAEGVATAEAVVLAAAVLAAAVLAAVGWAVVAMVEEWAAGCGGGPGRQCKGSAHNASNVIAVPECQYQKSACGCEDRISSRGLG